MTVEFTPYPKTPRLFRDVVVTEKIDGTNAAIQIVPSVTSPYGSLINTPKGIGTILAQSRKRLITPKDDNFGFARWVYENRDDLATLLGPGIHFGEWWGSGIQRGYGLPKGEKRFSLFNVGRWDNDALKDAPPGLGVVPVLYWGVFSESAVEGAVDLLRNEGSQASPGFKHPEGIVVYHTAAGQAFKVLLENDDISKTEAKVGAR